MFVAGHPCPVAGILVAGPHQHVVFVVVAQTVVKRALTLNGEIIHGFGV